MGSRVGVAFFVAAFIGAAGACAFSDPPPAPPSPHSNDKPPTPIGSPHIVRRFGSAGNDVSDFVQSRNGTLLLSVWDTTNSDLDAVVALAADDWRVLWRTPIHDHPYSIVGNGNGDVWVMGAKSIVHLSADGQVQWTVAAKETRLPALTPDQTLIYVLVNASNQALLQATLADGSFAWSVPLGGDPHGYDAAPATHYGTPAIDRSGHVWVWCEPCADKRTGFASIDIATGKVLNVVGHTKRGQDLTIDESGNLYFGHDYDYVHGISSMTPSGELRWSQKVGGGPVLLGSKRVVGDFVELSLADGSVLSSTEVAPDAGTYRYGVALALLGDERRLRDIGKSVDDSWTYQLDIEDAAGNVEWAIALEIEAVTIVGVGQLIAAQRTDSHTELVAVEAPTKGLAEGPWPMLLHDPGHTNSAAPSW